MAVKIRLAQRGKKKNRSYRVVVADARSPRDGKYIEDLGFYNPKDNPSTVDIDIDSRIPEEYIDDIKIRLNLYMRLSKTREIEGLEEIKKEISDRFGDIPLELERLIKITRIKILCHNSNNIISITGNLENVVIKFKDSLLNIKFFLENNLDHNIDIKSKTMLFIPENSEKVLEETEILINKIINIQNEIIEKFNNIST